MSAIYPNSIERRFASTLARGFTEEAVKFRRRDARAALDDIMRGLAKLHAVTGKTDYLDDTLAGLLDVAGNIQGELDRDLDNAGTYSDEKIDVSEIHALLAKIRADLG